MTITAMAKQLNVSTMTIYRRCKKNGVSIEGLREEGSSDLTAEGVSIIASLFDATAPQAATVDDVTKLQPSYATDTQTASQGVLEARLEGLEALIEQLTGERDELRRQLAAAQAALAAEQADRAQERLLLTQGQPTTTRRWWTSWWKHK